MEKSDSINIRVTCHEGYKTDEYPVLFFIENFRFEIIEIIDRWYQGEINPDFRPSNYFKVKTSDDKVFILKHDSSSDDWFLLVRDESINL